MIIMVQAALPSLSTRGVWLAACLLGIFVVGPPAARAGELPRLLVGWRGAGNQPVPLSLRRTIKDTQWIWRKPRPDLPQGGPALRFVLRIPVVPGWTFARAASLGAEVGRMPDEGGATPTVWRFQVNLLAREAQFALYLVNPQGTVRQLHLDIAAVAGPPEFRFAPACAAYEGEAVAVPAAAASTAPGAFTGQPLFFGVMCTVEGKTKLLVDMIREPGVKWAPLPGKAENKAISVRFLSRLPVDDQPTPALRIRYLDARNQPGEYALKFKEKYGGKRWGVGIGLAGTMFWYNETLQDLKLRQEGLTAKASFSFQIIPRAFLADVTVFGTVFAFDVNPSDRPELYTLGANGRLGYRLPIDWAKVDWTLYAGYYYWTTFVRSNSYGVNSLSGPQLFAQVSLAQPRKLPFYVYGKFATISDLTEFFSLGNYEVAAGGGIGFWLSPTALMFTFDLAHTQFARGLNSMSLQTISLGLTQRF
jgi:hypothetical protein